MLKSFAAYAAVAAVAIAASVSMAQSQPEQPAYLDDRSTPQQLVLSYYNAIDRAEYARAYSYYGADDAPAYDAWQAQYGDTVRIEVSFGEMAQEGAAGSIYYTLPVTLDLQKADGGHDVSFGCFQIRLAQPAIQAPPFEPMHITANDLKPRDAKGFAPAKCG